MATRVTGSLLEELGLTRVLRAAGAPRDLPVAGVARRNVERAVARLDALARRHDAAIGSARPAGDELVTTRGLALDLAGHEAIGQLDEHLRRGDRDVAVGA